MMVYPIYVYGSGVLNKKAESVEKEHEGLDTLVRDMFETMYAAEGVGLAAPQIGKSLRLFVVDTRPNSEEDEEPVVKCFINPEIVDRFGDEEYYTEGCLSVPGINEDVLRFNTIRMKYLDGDFNEYEEVFGGTAARVIQHEYDHLDGILFVERLAPLRKRLLKSRLVKMLKGDFVSRFKTKQIK